MFFRYSKHPYPFGFSLTEILIALAIMGVISAFGVIKIRESMDYKMYKDRTKAAAAEIGSLLLKYKQQKNAGVGTTAIDIFNEYANYISLDTTSTIDGSACEGTLACDAWNSCFKMSNGAVIRVRNIQSFNGTSSHHAIKFKIDPDGVVTGLSGDAGKALPFYLYFDGKVRARDNILEDTVTNTSTDDPNSGCVPDWWTWD